MSNRCLLLTSWFFPVKILRWEDAITLLYLGKAERVVDYEESVSSPSTSMKLPAVLRIVRSTAPRKKQSKFSRVNVYTRDAYRCQYCGNAFKGSQLTYDHVVPRARGGQTTWDNIVTCCKPCNDRKADKTCEEAGMFPIKRPVRPTALPLTPPSIDEDAVPAEWQPFIQTFKR